MKASVAQEAPEETAHRLPPLRLDIIEAAKALRISRAQLYNRIQSGALKTQKDGARTFVRWTELERYVDACDQPGRA